MACPKCHQTSGNSWSQCEGACPMPMSPHYQNTLYVDGVPHTVVREIPRTMADHGFQRIVLAKDGVPCRQVSVPAQWYERRKTGTIVTGGCTYSFRAGGGQ